MKRKLISLLMVVVLVAIMAVPAFAKAYTIYTTYSGAEVESNARCGGDSYYASTNTFSSDFMVQTFVWVYFNDSTVPSQVVWGGKSLYSSSIGADGAVSINKIMTEHKADSTVVYSAFVYPSE